MKYSILLANSFKKEAKKLNKEDIKLTMQIIDRLAKDEILEEKYKDHKLKGKYTGCKECHIKPNLLLIYKKEKSLLVLTALRIGSHSELL